MVWDAVVCGYRAHISMNVLGGEWRGLIAELID